MGNRQVLLERLAYALEHVLEQGIAKGAAEPFHDPAEDDWPCDDSTAALQRRQPDLRPALRLHCDVPMDAKVSAEQAESALGHSLADDVDEADDCPVDKDELAEHEALAGCPVNPAGLNYSWLSLNFSEFSDKDFETVGWSRADWLSHNSVDSTGLPAQMCAEPAQVLESSVVAQQQQFAASAQGADAEALLAVQVASLDPTQQLVFETVQRWAVS